MSEMDEETKKRDRAIAQNEAERQTMSAFRISTWAIVVAGAIGLAAVGWVLLHNQ